MKKIILFLICFLIFSSNAKASCSYSEIARLKKLATNVNISYDYEIKNKEALFNITITNLTKDIYIYDTFNDKKYTDQKEITVPGYIDGVTYRFHIKSNNKDCIDDLLLTKFVDLPQYNKYYGDSICSGIEDYVLCQRWGSFKVKDYEEYVSNINAYKESLKVIEEKPVIEKEIGLLEKIYDILVEYYYVGLILIIVVCLTIIIVKSKKDKFDF